MLDEIDNWNHEKEELFRLKKNELARLASLRSTRKEQEKKNRRAARKAFLQKQAEKRYEQRLLDAEQAFIEDFKK